MGDIFIDHKSFLWITEVNGLMPRRRGWPRCLTLKCSVKYFSGQSSEPVSGTPAPGEGHRFGTGFRKTLSAREKSQNRMPVPTADWFRSRGNYAKDRPEIKKKWNTFNTGTHTHEMRWVRISEREKPGTDSGPKRACQASTPHQTDHNQAWPDRIIPKPT